MSAQSILALETANAQRSAVAKLKQRIRDREVTLVDLLEDPPPCIAQYGLVDVVRLGYSSRGRYKATAAVTILGREAVRDGINLLCPIGMASLRSRRWVAAHVVWCRTRGAGLTALTVDGFDDVA